MSLKMLRSTLMALALILVTTAAVAQTGVLFVKDGMVGIGKSNPAVGLDVASTDPLKSRIVVTNNGGAGNRTMLRLENNGFPLFVMKDSGTGGEWLMTGGNVFIFSKIGSGKNEMTVASGGNVTIGGILVQGSSRSIKTDFAAVDNLEILDRLVQLPLQEWRYKHDSASVRHFGPFSEDFSDLFGLGASSEGISSLDVGGVTIAAVQGLYEIIQEKDEALAALELRNESLEDRLAALERAVAAASR